MPTIHIRRLGFALAIALAATTLSACGEQVAQQVVERGLENMSDQDEIVDIDLGDDGEQTITITDEDGNTGTSVIGGSELPDGFPAGLIPDDATVTQVFTFDEDGKTQQLVMYSSDRTPGELHQHYLELIPSLGYEVTQETMRDLEGMAQFSVDGEGPDDEVGVIGMTADDMTSVTAMRRLDPQE